MRRIRHDIGVLLRLARDAWRQYSASIRVVLVRNRRRIERQVEGGTYPLSSPQIARCGADLLVVKWGCIRRG